MPDNTVILTLEEVERDHILYVLKRCDFHRADAASLLDINRRTLYRKLKKYKAQGHVTKKGKTFNE